MQIIRGDYGGGKTAIGYLRICRIMKKRENALKASAQKERLFRGISATSDEIRQMRRDAEKSVGEEHGEIFGVYLTILDNSPLQAELCARIEGGASSEEAVRALLGDGAVHAEGEFSLRHIKECFDILLKVLEDVECPDLPPLPKERGNGGLIFVSDGESGALSSLLRRLSASTDRDDLPAGIVCSSPQELRAAVSLGLPAILICNGRLPDEKSDGVTAILDCPKKRLILDPDLTELEKYSESEKDELRRSEELTLMAGRSSVTAEGERIYLCGEYPAERNLSPSLSRESLPSDNRMLIITDGIEEDRSEEAQYAIYRRLAEGGGGAVVRLFELPHAEKGDPLSHRGDPSRILGLRGVGLFTLARQAYKRQLRALLRAAAHGGISALLPCVCSRSELGDFRSILREAKAELSAEELSFSDLACTAAELSTPAALLRAEDICSGVGLAVIDLDRIAALVSGADPSDPLASDRLWEGITPALSLCSDVIRGPGTHPSRLAVRGALASDPRLTHSLIGCGFRRLYLSEDALLPVKEQVISFGRELQSKI